MDLTPFQIFYIVVETIIAFLAIIGNGFILFVFAKEERLRRKRNFYLMSLSLSDFLLGALGIPTTIMTRLAIPADPEACMWSLCILDTTRLLTIYSITAISIDRLKACLKPVAYRNDTSNHTTLFSILEFWIFSFILGYLPLLGWNLRDTGNLCIFPFKIGPDYVRFFTIIGIVIPLVIIVISYSFIIVVIRRISRNSGRREAAPSNERKSAQSREVTATIRISIIVATYVLCELPISIVNIINSTSEVGLVTNVDLVHWLLALAHIHSAVNPFLYAFNVKEFKDAVGKVWKHGDTEITSAVRSSTN